MLPSLLPAPCARSLSTCSPWLWHGITGHGAKPTGHCSPRHHLLLTMTPPGDPPSLPRACAIRAPPLARYLGLAESSGHSSAHRCDLQTCQERPSSDSCLWLCHSPPPASPQPPCCLLPCPLPAHRGLCRRHAGVAQRDLHGEPAWSHALYSSTRCRWAATHCTRCDRGFFFVSCHCSSHAQPRLPMLQVRDSSVPSVLLSALSVSPAAPS